MSALINEERWTAFDGLELYAVVHRPETIEPTAVMAFVHGHGTHARRYDEWFQSFTSNGIAVVTFDLRGHGRSGGKRGTIHRYWEYLEDVALLMEHTKHHFPGIPRILYGHSMGATIVLSYLGMGRDLPDMAISASAWLELVQPPGRFKSLAIWLADSLFPQVTIGTGLKRKDFAPANSQTQTVKKDPLMHKRISARCFREVQRATGQISCHSLPSALPMLFLHGNHDRVSSWIATRNLSDSLGSQATCREWDEGPHQLHAWERNDEVTDYTLEWINKQR
ncbi:MAG: alpha/beta hydrolase [Marinilabiliales bacterium]|nr:alpha/beta hydrolase [Marinilabiliales bacterium]